MTPKKGAMRADVFLVERGHAATRSQAQRLIAAGVQWRLSQGLPWQKVTKNGDDIPGIAEVELLDSAEARYLSRGGLKLEGALKATGLAVAGWHCLDVGQSTGGFTDCLLQQGVAQVVGVDVGHGQLHERLGNDLRVVGVEGMNARSMTAESLLEACEEALSERVEQEHLDFTNPQTVQWWQNGVTTQLLEMGIDSTWNDNNEYEVWDGEARCFGFGKEIAMIAGIDHVQGDAMVVLDADLQDPPELIPEMIKYWEEGYDDVLFLTNL